MNSREANKEEVWNTKKIMRRIDMKTKTKIVAINQENIVDRLRLCWSHLVGWEDLEVVQKSKEWLERVNSRFTPTTHIAYSGELPVGMIEGIPVRLLQSLGLCPCRWDHGTNYPSEEEIDALGEKFGNDWFISCLWVTKEHQHRGIGKVLLSYVLKSKSVKEADGVLVYVGEKDEEWEEHFHWPTGPLEFYLKAGFTVIKEIADPKGHLLRYMDV